MSDFSKNNVLKDKIVEHLIKELFTQPNFNIFVNQEVYMIDILNRNSLNP